MRRGWARHLFRIYKPQISYLAYIRDGANRCDPTLGAVISSVLVTVSGCLVAGFGDLAFDLTGYTYALTSCGLQARQQGLGFRV